MARDSQLLAVVTPPSGAAYSFFIENTNRPIHIGSGATCSIRISSPDVLPLEAELVGHNGVLIRDRSNGDITHDSFGRFSEFALPSGQAVSFTLQKSRVRLTLTLNHIDGVRLNQRLGATSRPASAQEEASYRERLQAAISRRVTTTTRKDPPPANEPIPTIRGRGGNLELQLATSAETRRLSFDQDVVKIGRSSECQVTIPEIGDGISRVHAQIVKRNNWLVLEDLDSTNGTWLDGAEIKRVVLRPGQEYRIELGRTDATLFVQVRPKPVDDARSTPPLPRPDVNPTTNESVPTSSGPGGHVYLQLTTSDEEPTIEASFEDDIVMVGTSNECQLAVPESAEGVSRYHARIVNENGWFVLEDLGSTNGTRMNGAAIERVVLRPTVQYRFDLGGAAELAVRVREDAMREYEPSRGGARAWIDLPPATAKPQEPRARTVFSQALRTIGERADGATLDEIRESFRELDLYHHDPLALLRWQNKHRGWGFRMNPLSGRVTVWSLDESTQHPTSAPPSRITQEPSVAVVVPQQNKPAVYPDLDVHAQLRAELEDQREFANAERLRLDHERRRLEAERREFEKMRQEHLASIADTSTSLPPLGERDQPSWLLAIPEPDRRVFVYLEEHGSIDESETTRLLGGPRQYRQFTNRFEASLALVPFRVRIEHSSGIKCYVRDGAEGGSK